MKSLGDILNSPFPGQSAGSRRSRNVPERNASSAKAQEAANGPASNEAIDVTDVNGKHLRLVKTQPRQYDLFSSVLPDDRHAERYSNTIELYDAAPKYFSSTKKMQEMRIGEGKKRFLDELVRHFEHKGKQYTLTIYPARVPEKNGQSVEYYPSEAEEFVEEALRKIVCDDPLSAVYLNDKAGVQFTGYQLRQELKRQGHAMNWPNLWKALQICAGVRLTITARHDDNDVYLSAPMFPVLAMSSRRQYENDPKTARCYVEFNPLVTQSLNCLTYRQYDYITFMRLRRPLSRWLLKRLSHNYVQASMIHPYTIKLNTIVRDSGLISPSRSTRHRMRDVDTALDELREHRDEEPIVLQEYRKDMTQGKRGKIEEVTYTLFPHMDFVSQAKKANRRQYNLIAEACEEGITTEEDYNRFVKETFAD